MDGKCPSGIIGEREIDDVGDGSSGVAFMLCADHLQNSTSGALN